MIEFVRQEAVQCTNGVQKQCQVVWSVVICLQFDLARFGSVWPGLVWFGLVWFGLVWFGWSGFWGLYLGFCIWVLA